MSAEFDLSDEPRQFAKGSSALAYGLSSNAKNLGVWPRYGARLIPRKIARFKPCIFIPSSLFAFKLALWQRRILVFHPHKSPVGMPTRRGAIPTRFGGVSATITLPGTTGGPRAPEPMFPNSIPRRRGLHDYRIRRPPDKGSKIPPDVMFAITM
jgi:hypothetical protein